MRSSRGSESTVLVGTGARACDRTSGTAEEGTCEHHGARGVVGGGVGWGDGCLARFGIKRYVNSRWEGGGSFGWNISWSYRTLFTVRESRRLEFGHE